MFAVLCASAPRALAGRTPCCLSGSRVGPLISVVLFSDQFGLAGIAASPRVFNQKIAAVVSGGIFDTYCPMASSQMALM